MGSYSETRLQWNKPEIRRLLRSYCSNPSERWWRFGLRKWWRWWEVEFWIYCEDRANTICWQIWLRGNSKESKITPKFLSWAPGRAELPLMKKSVWGAGLVTNIRNGFWNVKFEMSIAIHMTYQVSCWL